MTEKEILKKIDAWDSQDKIQAIVDFVEPLAVEQKTPKVLSELARAYNNLYWLDSNADNEKWLHKAIEVFQYLEKELPEEDLGSWNFRIGWSYFYLGENELAKKHFEKHMELYHDCYQSEVPQYLECLDLAIKENRNCAEIWNNGHIRVNDQIKFFREVLEEKAPAMLPRLGKPATEEALNQFEKSLNGGGVLGFLKSKINGVKLPEDFRELHLNFSGQSDTNPFLFKENEKLVSLEEIPAIQQKIVEKLTQTFGKNWQDIKMPESSDNDNEEENNTIFEDAEVIKNTLYNPKWIPLLYCDNYCIYTDLDPVDEELSGQVIYSYFGENLETYTVSWLFPHISAWIGYMKNQIKDEVLTYDEESNTLKFPENTYTPPIYKEEEKKALHDYITKNFGEIIKVVPDPDFDEEYYDINCEICIIAPSENRDYYTLITSGAGAYIADAPQGEPYSTEIILNLPKTWNPDSTEEKDLAPLEWLRTFARVPLRHDTWLDAGHTIPFEFEGTDFTGLIFSISGDYDEEKDEYTPYVADIAEDHQLVFLAIVPLYKEEMDYKLDHSSDELFDKFVECELPYPPIFDVNRKNTCEGYEISENPHLLDNIAWSFGERFEPSLTNFWNMVFLYNQQIDNDLENYTPFATLFNSKKVKVIYEAWIKDKSQLLDFEKIIDETDLEGEPDEDGLYQVEILMECTANDDKFLAIELLQWLNNALFNKELGDHIFFEGISLEGTEEDGTPVVYLELGS